MFILHEMSSSLILEMFAANGRPGTDEAFGDQSRLQSTTVSPAATINYASKLSTIHNQTFSAEGPTSYNSLMSRVCLGKSPVDSATGSVPPSTLAGEGQVKDHPDKFTK